jgi:hypothetical protein
MGAEECRGWLKGTPPPRLGGVNDAAWPCPRRRPDGASAQPDTSASSHSWVGFRCDAQTVPIAGGNPSRLPYSEPRSADVGSIGWARGVSLPALVAALGLGRSGQEHNRTVGLFGPHPPKRLEAWPDESGSRPIRIGWCPIATAGGARLCCRV